MSTSEFAPAITSSTQDQVAASSERFAKLFAFVPDDRLNWTPSSTSRSALQLASHCALVNAFFAKILGGRLSDPMPTPQEFFTRLHADERETTTRGVVQNALRESTSELLAAIGAIDTETIDADRTSPFGAFPARFWLGQCVEHLAYHTGQMAYLQTLWGDLDDHMG